MSAHALIDSYKDLRSDDNKLTNYDEYATFCNEGYLGKYVGIVYQKRSTLYCEYLGNNAFWVINGGWGFSMPTLTKFNNTNIPMVTNWGKDFVGSIILPTMDSYADYNIACDVIQSAIKCENVRTTGNEDGR